MTVCLQAHPTAPLPEKTALPAWDLILTFKHVALTPFSLLLPTNMETFSGWDSFRDRHVVSHCEGLVCGGTSTDILTGQAGTTLMRHGLVCAYVAGYIGISVAPCLYHPSHTLPRTWHGSLFYNASPARTQASNRFLLSQMPTPSS